MVCSHSKHKIKRTHGEKSRGVIVCKLCKQLIKKGDISNARRRRKKSF